MRRFEFRDDKSAKFWAIELAGRSFTVNYGKIGSAGQTQTKDFLDDSRAKREHGKLIAEKLAKGYQEISREGVLALAESPYLTRLTCLNLAHNHLDAKSALALAESPNLAHLTSLILYENPIGP
jgi:predicted DNA-binding WGR domain protein